MCYISALSVALVISFLMKQVCSYTESCIGEFCFTTPDSNELRNFDNAKSWCTEHKSALAVVNDGNVQLALTTFLNSSNASAMAFINMKLSQHDSTWFLVNGSTYNGDIGNQGASDYKLYCHLKPIGNMFQVNALQPTERNRYICEFQSAKCLNNSANSIVYNGRCYMKFENETLTWYQARERCFNKGGDLASFQTNLPNSWNPPFDTTWLNLSFIYWLGIRWLDRRWNSPDGGIETIYTWWSTGKPNNHNYRCVCVDPSGNPLGSWTDCDCNGIMKFVCLKIVPTTTASTTAATTTTTTTKCSTIAITSDVIAGSNFNSTANVLAIGLGAGIGGGVFLILLIVIIVVAVTVIRKRRRKNDGIESSSKVEKPREAEVANVGSTTPAIPDIYAQIPMTDQHPTNNEPKIEVIYEKPEFVTKQNSSTYDLDPTNLRQGNVKSIMLEGPGFSASTTSLS